MGDPFVLKILTDTNKRFILSLEESTTTNTLIKIVKKYYMHYFKHKYYIEYIYTPDRFIIFDDVPLKVYYKTGDFCYIKGQEGGECTLVNLPNKVKYDTFVRKSRIEDIEDTKRFKNQPNILSNEINNNNIKDNSNYSNNINNCNVKSNNINNDSNHSINIKDNSNYSNNISRRKSKENIVEEKRNILKDSGLNTESPNKLEKKKNNKDARNFNIKNGINPNVIVRDFPNTPSSLNEQSNIYKQSVDKSTENCSIKNPSIKISKTSVKNNIKTPKPKEESDNLFVVENINKSTKKQVVLDIDKIKQVKRKKKINYDEL